MATLLFIVLKVADAMPSVSWWWLLLIFVLESSTGGSKCKNCGKECK